jgi:iron-sulfur cluster assembly protein
MITITERALAKLDSIKEPGKALRVAVVGGGCSGMSYKLSWVTLGETTLTDKVLPFGNIFVAVDAKSALYLKETELDYSDELNDNGFKWNNKLATRTCGCGSSFS